MAVKFSKHIPYESLHIPDKRYRKRIDGLDELADSIKRYGLLSSVVVDSKGAIAAGERRFRAIGLLYDNDRDKYEELFPEGIPVRMADALSDRERRAIEIEENAKRLDLTWQETATAFLEYHEEREATEGHWTTESTAEALVTSVPWTREHIQVGRALREGNEHVMACAGLKAALKVLQRSRHRAVDSDTEILSEVLQEQAKARTEEEEGESPTPSEPTLRAASKDIIQGSFFTLLPEYSGRKFNFIHCDFPYGIHHHKSGQGGSRRREAYEDTPELYWEFVNALLKHQDRIMSKSCHLMFWFSMKHFRRTVDALGDAGFVVNPWPLIWHKSDNKGIIPDAERGPRNTYETAIFATRGDRRIVRAVANSYAAPTGKSDAIHISQKPVPVLRHFFRMIVDENTEMLDPTSGSATALIAADSLRAKRVLGWEFNKEFVDVSRSALNQARRLAVASKEAEDG